MTRQFLLSMVLVQVGALGCGAAPKTTGPLEAHVTGLVVQGVGLLGAVSALLVVIEDFLSSAGNFG